MLPVTSKERLVILYARIQEAFHPGTLSDELLEYIAEITSKIEDIRHGFNILLVAGSLAEKEGATRIEAKHVEDAAKSATLVIQAKELLERAQRLTRGT